MRRPAALLAVAALAAAAPVLARAGRTVEVTQEHRRFSVDTLTIGRGDVVRFVNADEFLHQIYVKALGFSTPSGEEPGQQVDVAFPTSGTFEVRCEIHPRMLLTVTVQ
ncbi:MAG: cupredoxin domain-containing protein [Janthinobacterium lividum]